KQVPLPAKDLPAELEWAIRSRCDQAEMLLRLGKAKDAQALTAAFVKDPVLGRSRYRDLGRYYHGYASFLVKDYPAAETTLTMLAPFADPVFGGHARYLLARTHHVAAERAEATLNYQGVVEGYAKSVKDASVRIRQPKLDASERAQLEELLKGPPPDHVMRSTFYLG